MERFRRQRSQDARFSSPSKVTTIIDRSSDDMLNSNDRHHRGHHHTVKQKFQISESESSSSGRCRTTLEHQLAFESGRSLPPAGNLIKSLLADEMSKETDFRRRAPSVIAKLMGLERLPSQHGTKKQAKRPDDGFDGKTVTVETCRHRKTCNNQSCRKITKEEQLFKDVYEVRESLKGRNEGYTSQVPPNRKHTEDEMAFIRQKFMGAKRLSTDEKLQDSKEFHDTIDVLSSNNHLFLKFLEEPDSLFAKRLHDLNASTQSHCGNRNVKECVHGHLSHRHTRDSDRSVIIPGEGKEAVSAAPSKIVLLKPNNGWSQKTAKSFSSSSSCELWSDVEMHTVKQMDARTGEAELWGKKRSAIDSDFSAHKSQESTELAKEITQQMKSKSGEASFNVPFSGYRGYSADESSHMSGNDSSYESDTIFLISETSNSSFRGKSSSPRYAESSINREGKKRLSERWKMTHKSGEIRADKGTTLGEMLSMPDLDLRSPNLDGAIQDGSSGRFDSNVRLPGSVEPLGISSKDGWKDGSIRSFSRSRSLPNAYDHFQNPESHIKREVSLVCKEGGRRGRKKAVNRDLSWKEGSAVSRRLSDKKSHSSHRMSTEMANDVREVEVGENGKKSVFQQNPSPELNSVILEAPTCRLDTILNLDSLTEIEHETPPVSLNSGDDLLPAAKLSIDVQVKDDSSSSDLHGSTPQKPSRTWKNDSLPCSQNTAAQPESPVSSKEADQPSPVSVLEAHFPEDVSSGSECFERVGADLHGLRMQLQLLKLESEASDEDETSAGSAEAAKAPTSTKPDSWEASYTADVLAELGLEDSDPNMLMSTWSSSECPVGPWVFDKLEKKYSDQEPNCSGPDRTLLFDRIRYGVMEIAQRSINPHPWVKTRSGSGPTPQWSKAWFEAQLRRVLATQAKRETEGNSRMEELPLRGEQWMDLGVHIDGIGREIGKMVLDELISQCLRM